MDDDTPVDGETYCPAADKWEDFVAGLNSLSRFAAIEANKLRSREYQRIQKQLQRDRAKQRTKDEGDTPRQRSIA